MGVPYAGRGEKHYEGVVEGAKSWGSVVPQISCVSCLKSDHWLGCREKCLGGEDSNSRQCWWMMC